MAGRLSAPVTVVGRCTRCAHGMLELVTDGYVVFPVNVDGVVVARTVSARPFLACSGCENCIALPSLAAAPAACMGDSTWRN